MDGPDGTAASPASIRWPHVTITVLVLAFVIWWWWPSIARDPDRLDVLVLGRGEVVQATEAIERRIREEGLSVEILAVEPCDDADAVADTVADRSPAVVVVSPSRPCDDWPVLVRSSKEVSNARVIALVQPGSVDETARRALDDLDVVVADPARILPEGVDVRVPCLWWDDCEPDGLIVVRGDDGGLTPAGAERVARVLTGNIA